jgi:hypothetical protein
MPMVSVSISVAYRTVWPQSLVMAELIAVGGSDLCGVAVDGSGSTFIASRGSGAILAREGVCLLAARCLKLPLRHWRRFLVCCPYG